MNPQEKDPPTLRLFDQDYQEMQTEPQLEHPVAVFLNLVQTAHSRKTVQRWLANPAVAEVAEEFDYIVPRGIVEPDQHHLDFEQATADSQRDSKDRLAITAIQNLLDISGHGKLLKFDDTTWENIFRNQDYKVAKDIFQGSSQRRHLETRQRQVACACLKVFSERFDVPEDGAGQSAAPPNRITRTFNAI